MGEPAKRRRRGRPWGPIRAQTEEARALAVFLRQRITASGKTLEELGQQMHVSKSQISAGVGGAVPDERFVEDLLAATTPDVRARKIFLERARRLLSEARNPAPLRDPEAGEGQPAGAMVPLVLALKLDDARERVAELERVRGNSQLMIMILLSMLAQLQHTVNQLDSGHVSALLGSETDKASRRDHLARLRRQQDGAQERLGQAQARYAQAVRLVTRARAEAGRLAAEIIALGGRPPDLPVTSSPLFTEPGGWDDIEQALRRADEQLDADAAVLAQISGELPAKKSRVRQAGQASKVLAAVAVIIGLGVLAGSGPADSGHPSEATPSATGGPVSPPGCVNVTYKGPVGQVTCELRTDICALGAPYYVKDLDGFCGAAPVADIKVRGTVAVATGSCLRYSGRGTWHWEHAETTYDAARQPPSSCSAFVDGSSWNNGGKPLTKCTPSYPGTRITFLARITAIPGYTDVPYTTACLTANWVL